MGLEMLFPRLDNLIETTELRRKIKFQLARFKVVASGIIRHAATPLFSLHSDQIKQTRVKQVFPLGMAMNKNLTVNMGNCNHRKYIPILLDIVQRGLVNPQNVLTQVQPLSSVIDAYHAFDEQRDNWVKVELVPGL